MSTLMDKIVEVKNKANRSLREKHPCLFKILLRYSANKRYGYQFLDEEKRVVDEYTLIMGDNQIRGYEPGISSDVCLTVGMKKSLIQTHLEGVEQYFEHPLSTIFLKYLPRYSVYLVRGDIKFGRTKK